MKKAVKLMVLFVATLTLTACNDKKVVDINKTKEVSINALSMKIPTLFEKSAESSESMHFYGIKDYEYDLARCSLTFSYMEDFGDPLEEDIREDLSSNYFQAYDIVKKTINGKEWTIAEAKSIEDEGLYYIEGEYLAKYNGNVYTFEYTNYVPEKVSCKPLIEKIVNSLKFN